VQISVDFAWSPHGIDGRNFDWAGLAAAADILFVMAYDMQSQVSDLILLLALGHASLPIATTAASCGYHTCLP